MTLTQDWVGYLDRSYEQIKRSLLTKLGLYTPEISDHSESNPLIIIISMFAGVAEMLNLYIDSIAKEAFLPTARKFSSIVKLAKLIDYSIKATNPATVNLLFSLTDNSNVITTYPGGDIIIPRGTLIFPLNSTIPFLTLQETILPAGQSSVYASAAQYDQITNDILGSTTGAANLEIPVSDSYVDGTMSIRINGVTWVLYNSFGLMDAQTKGFVVVIDEDAQAKVIFGDGVNGAIPGAGQTIYGDYQESQGSQGNLPPGSITQIQTVIVMPAGITLNVTNQDYSSGGTNFESIDEVRDRAPRSLRTLNRAVTYQDYVDIAKQVLGVGAAEVSYCCGKYVDVYIAPSSKGVATLALLQKVRDYFDCRKMITTKVDVKPAGVTRIWIKAKIYGNPLYLSPEIYDQVVTELDNKFGAGNIVINRKVSITDIISVIEALSKVDRIEIEKVKLEPYARPLENTLNLLNISFPVLPLTTAKHTYTIVYQQATTDFQVFRDGFFLNTVAIGANFADGGLVTFKMNAGIYADNDKWEFTIFPTYPEIFPSTVIETNDFSAPIVDVAPFIDTNTVRSIFSDLTIITQGSSSNCLPACN